MSPLYTAGVLTVAVDTSHEKLEAETQFEKKKSI